MNHATSEIARAMRQHGVERPRPAQVWPHPESLSLACAMREETPEGLHACTGDVCACECHLEQERLAGRVRLMRARVLA